MIAVPKPTPEYPASNIGACLRMVQGSKVSSYQLLDKDTWNIFRLDTQVPEEAGDFSRKYYRQEASCLSRAKTRSTSTQYRRLLNIFFNTIEKEPKQPTSRRKDIMDKREHGIATDYHNGGVVVP